VWIGAPGGGGSVDGMRVLFTTWAWPGHYYPMVPMAWALRAAGHEVRMTSQPELLPAMRASGLPVSAVGGDLDLVAAYRGGTRPVTDDGSTTQAFMAQRGTVKPSRQSRLGLYGDVAAAMTGDLLALARSWRPDLIVFDPLTWAGALVARLVGVPAVRSLFGPDITWSTQVTPEVASWATLVDGHGLGLDDVDLLGVSSVDLCPPSLQIPAPLHRIRTRYVPYNGPSEVPAWLPDRPARPRICLTWGTSTERRLGGEGFLPEAVLDGAAKLADGYGAELVLAITASQREKLPTLPEHVRVVESVPLDALLPTCRAIIHQGGAGSMLTAARHGLPQIAVTTFVDQAANGYQLVAAGVGHNLAANGLTAAELLAAGQALLDDPGYGKRAEGVRREMLAQPSPADAVTQLAELI
jgi:UDP:flavonoid glycosyltransferase YjiC (YdhE family)